MGYLFKKVNKMPLSDGAEVTIRKNRAMAKWIDSRTGRTRTAPLITDPDGSAFAGVEAKNWTMRYRDETGRLIERTTNCRDRDMAQRVLNDAENRVEKITAGVVSATENRVMEHVTTPISHHIEDYLESLRCRGVHKTTLKMRKYYLNTICDACKFAFLKDLDRSKAEEWVNGQATDSGMGARTCNGYLVALSAFGNWLLRSGRIVGNPFVKMQHHDEDVDARRPRRALTGEAVPIGWTVFGVG